MNFFLLFFFFKKKKVSQGNRKLTGHLDQFLLHFELDCLHPMKMVFIFIKKFGPFNCVSIDADD